MAGPLLRPTIRFRLTALYGGMFLIAGILLLGLVYVLVRNSLQVQSDLYHIRLSANTCLQINDTKLCDDATVQRQLNAIQQFQENQALNELLRQSLTALLGLAVVAFAFGYIMAGRVLQPLGRITRTARKVVGSDLHQRINLDGPDDEFKELADTFDEMLERLDRAFDSQRRFVANASHELRTPLAINRTLLEVQLSDPDAPAEVKQLGKSLLATNQRSEALVEGLLLLARSENELTEKDRQPVDLAEVAERALEQCRADAASQEVEVRSDLQEVVVRGNGVLLERVALNLVQNAVKYNEPGGWVRVEARRMGEGGLLEVSNTGAVVPGYEVDGIFEPFRRLAERTGSDKGVGLGLSIVRSVVRAHGGSIAAEPRPGGGLSVRVLLPS
ncbi:two-component sensor histidine kinase [Mangrovactinospora gilvigrisea]|uniref:histidine kinase n=1 Tax=Mangrovactinospora gilvigrisea TaxID=1428644 RepID=A0A1J7BHE3_9ACTN|nr:two-component sensor histidine kinase [Mangrovactinospora gilvigrisea]